MKLVNIKQNTGEWLGWRGKGLGASDAGTIMGISPWSTPFQLWLEKTGQAQREEPNGFASAAMARGVAMEPEARAWYEKATGLLMPPLSAEHDAYPFIRASLDGGNIEARVGIEIKCPGKVGHDKTIKSNAVPDNYYAQVQQQLMVTGFDRIDYVSYRPGETAVVIPVLPDAVYQEALLKALKAFWNCIEFNIAPEITAKDNENAFVRVKKQVDSLNDSVKVIEQLLFANKLDKRRKNR